MPLRLTLLGGPDGAERAGWLKHNLAIGEFPGAHVVGEDEREALSRLARLPGTNTAILVLNPLTDPQSSRRSFALDPEFCEVVVGETVIVLDASQGAAPLIDGRPLRLQAIAADAIILAKLEASEPPQLSSLIATARLLNPRAALFGALRDEDADLPPDGLARSLLPSDLGEASVAAVLPLSDVVTWTVFSLWLSALLHARGPDILRVRAWTRTRVGALLVHGANGEMFAPEFWYGVAPGAGEAIILGRGFTAAQLTQSLERFAGV